MSVAGGVRRAAVGAVMLLAPAACDDFAALSPPQGMSGGVLPDGGGNNVGCGAGLSRCGGACVDATRDAANCGTCGHACRDPNGACRGGVCQASCTAGLGDCDGQAANGCETDLNRDAANCGQCRHACEAGSKCRSGTCTGTLVVGNLQSVWSMAVDGNGLCVDEDAMPWSVYCFDLDGTHRRTVMTSVVGTFRQSMQVRGAFLYGVSVMAGQQASNSFRTDRGGAGQPILLTPKTGQIMGLAIDSGGALLGDAGTLYLYDLALGASSWSAAASVDFQALGNDRRGKAYWIDSAGLHQLDEAGKTASLLTALPGSRASAPIVAAGTGIYWRDISSPNGETIVRYDPATKAVAQAYASRNPLTITDADDTAVYFLESPALGTYDLKRLTPDAKVTTLASTLNGVRDARVAAGYVYWVAVDPFAPANTQYGVYRLPL